MVKNIRDKIIGSFYIILIGVTGLTLLIVGISPEYIEALVVLGLACIVASIVGLLMMFSTYDITKGLHERFNKQDGILTNINSTLKNIETSQNYMVSSQKEIASTLKKTGSVLEHIETSQNDMVSSQKEIVSSQKEMVSIQKEIASSQKEMTLTLKSMDKKLEKL